MGDAREGGRHRLLALAVPVARDLAHYDGRSAEERRDLERIRELVAGEENPFDRSLPLHLTGSAVVLDPAGLRVLLRWHERQQAWLQVGGHADPDETELLTVALREAGEETGLTDLRPWPRSEEAAIIHAVIVPVAGRLDEPEHEHADVRFLLTTSSPAAARPENSRAALRWVPLEEAIGEVSANLAVTLQRVASLAGTLPSQRPPERRVEDGR